MTPDIGLILGIDGIATGSIYVLVGLGLVLIFSVTRVVFVPFGDIVAFSALTLASIQLGRHARHGLSDRRAGGAGLSGRRLSSLVPRPAAAASPMGSPVMACCRSFRRRSPSFTAGIALPAFAQILLAIALVVPIGPLIERIALRPLADASVLLLLIVSVALTFGLSGLGLLFFGAEGFRTKPLTNEMFRFGTVIVTAQTLLMVGSAIVFSLLLYLYFEHTLSGKALRATAINRVGARIVGIRPASTGTLAFSAGLAPWRHLRRADRAGDDACITIPASSSD